MFKFEIKTIKGNKYLYIKDKVKVNTKKVIVFLYVGRLEKITKQTLRSKLYELDKIKLKKFIDFWLNKQRLYLNDENVIAIEMIHYNYQLSREQFPDDIKMYDDKIFVRYVHGTTAIEGNTISQKQAEELLEHKITPTGKSLREVYEIDNFKRLKNFLDGYDGDISEKIIKKIHAIIMENILISPGEYRNIQVLIEKAEHEPPPTFEIPRLMNGLVGWYQRNGKKLHPFELAVLLHTKFVTVHPFNDGNGRVARALMNFVLEKNEYPRLYLGLEHRDSYLEVVAEGNKENYRPIIDFLYDIYIDQYNQVIKDIQEVILKKRNEDFYKKYEVLEQFKKL